MGGASDEFPLLAAYNLYAADINGDGRAALFTTTPQIRRTHS